MAAARSLLSTVKSVDTGCFALSCGRSEATRFKHLISIQGVLRYDKVQLVAIVCLRDSAAVSL